MKVKVVKRQVDVPKKYKQIRIDEEQLKTMIADFVLSKGYYVYYGTMNVIIKSKLEKLFNSAHLR